jgi:chromatin-remodeling ATPase INO80
MQTYWRKYDKEERERARAEQKAAQEKRKHDEEIREAKRQQMKLNFLLTQTELFAHFVAKKIGGMLRFRASEEPRC